MFEKIEFYRVDIRLLRELGHEVVVAGSPRDIDIHADLYFCWWWGHSPYPLAVGLLRRKPVIVTGAFDFGTCRAELPGLCYLDRPLWQRAILAGALRLATYNLFISQHEFSEVTQHLAVRNPVLAPLAIDTDLYTPGPTHAFRSDYFFSVCWMSRTNVIRKGVHRTIEAFAIVAREHKNLTLVLAGKPGDGEPSLKDLARQLGIASQVKFIGLISDEEKIKHYRNCLAYVQPTLYEGFGLAMAEAVACGCPVITSDRGAVPEVLGKYGRTVDPYDTNRIAECLSTVLNSERGLPTEQLAHDWIRARYSLGARRARLEHILHTATEGRRI